MTMKREIIVHTNLCMSIIMTKSIFHVQNIGHDINLVTSPIIHPPCKVY